MESKKKFLECLMRNRNVSIILIFLTLICFLIKLQFDVDSDRQSALYGLDKVSSQVNFLDELEKYCVSEDVSGKEGMSPPGTIHQKKKLIKLHDGDFITFTFIYTVDKNLTLNEFQYFGVFLCLK